MRQVRPLPHRHPESGGDAGPDPRREGQRQAPRGPARARGDSRSDLNLRARPGRPEPAYLRAEGLARGAQPMTLTLTIDGRTISVPEGTTIWEAARETGIEIPVLCHDPRLRPVGDRRMCVVDVGERVLAASRVRAAADGMTVHTRSDKAERR